jgi:hypothetical protein
MLPMASTDHSFGHDWTLHLWAIRQQQWNIQAMGHPGLFVSARPMGAFYPLFSYVGSGIYTLGAYLAMVIGPIAAYKLLFFGGICMAYGGFSWLSFQFGLTGWRAQVPGAMFVTATYFITDMVGRGDFAEFIALSSIPFVIAASCAMFSSRRVKLRHRLAVVLGAFVLSGSHNITLLWGTTFIAALGILAVATFCWRWPRPWPLRRAGQLVVLAIIGVGLNAWYLIPDLAYGLNTLVGFVTQHSKPQSLFITANVVLNPFRPADGSPPAEVAAFARDVRLSLPCLFAAWALIVLGFNWRRIGPALWVFVGGLLALLAILVVLTVAASPWAWLPHVFWSVQFTWRLGGYVLVTTALLVMIAIRVSTSSAATDTSTPRASTKYAAGALVAIVAFSAAAAIWQVNRVRSEYVSIGAERRTHSHFLSGVIADRYVVPPSWYSLSDFRAATPPVVAVPADRYLKIPLRRIRGDHFAGTVDVPDGRAPFVTNISADTHFIQVHGITEIGRTQDGSIVATRAATAPATGPLYITINEAKTVPLRVGAALSIAALLALAALTLWPFFTYVRSIRHAAPSIPDTFDDERNRERIRTNAHTCSGDPIPSTRSAGTRT